MLICIILLSLLMEALFSDRFFWILIDNFCLSWWQPQLHCQGVHSFMSLLTSWPVVLFLFLAGKGLSHRPRPSSPFSTDGSTVGTHSLGHQRATRPTRKPRSQGTAPHRRDAGADGEAAAENTFEIVCAESFVKHLLLFLNKKNM